MTAHGDSRVILCHERLMMESQCEIAVLLFTLGCAAEVLANGLFHREHPWVALV